MDEPSRVKARGVGRRVKVETSVSDMEFEVIGPR